MKFSRSKILTVLLLCISFATAQAGVCINNVVQTIANSVLVPIPFATVTLCSPGSNSSNCVANKVNIYTSAALSTLTSTNPFVTDLAANYYFCAPTGHYGLLITSSYGLQFVPDITLVDNSSSASWTCNTYGCYKTDPDGTVYQRGSATTTTNNCAGDTFPLPLSWPTTTNISLILQSTNNTSHFMVVNQKNTTNFVAASHDLSNDCDASNNFDWWAVGK